MHMTIGADKAAAFESVLGLYRSGQILGFTGLDDNPDPSPGRYSWDAVTAVTDRERMLRYMRWTLVDTKNTWLCGLKFEQSRLAGIGTYDPAGYFAGDVPAWAPEGANLHLSVGMNPSQAAEVISAYLTQGLLGSVRATEHDIAPPDRLDESALGALQPWDKWRLFTHDWGAIWLTFDHGRLSKIHHRIQCTELP